MRHEQDQQFGRLFRSMKESANKGTWDGRDLTGYFYRCRWRLMAPVAMVAVFTRDVGYHSSGWWKNPDYERCLHLSLSFVNAAAMFETGVFVPSKRDKKVTQLFVAGLFGSDRRWVWSEPPYTDTGKELDVWHYRLFCDAGWQPIKPRGEVYNRELTEAGWKSWSDVQDAAATEANQ